LSADWEGCTGFKGPGRRDDTSLIVFLERRVSWVGIGGGGVLGGSLASKEKSSNLAAVIAPPN